MTHYDLITCWQMAAPIEHVYRAISQPLLWPRWWPGRCYFLCLPMP
ncbi:hypothetical protein [Oceanisphaera sediminis]